MSVAVLNHFLNNFLDLYLSYLRTKRIGMEQTNEAFDGFL